MGYIDGFEDIMGMETGFLQYAMELLKKDYARELKILNVELPKADQIPAVKFSEIKELAAEKYITRCVTHLIWSRKKKY